MKKIETRIEIAAKAEMVWSVLMDFEKYGEWNPFLVKVEGEPKEGAFLENKIQLNERKSMTFKPKVLKVELNQEFRWLGKFLVKGVFDGEHYFILEEDGKGSTTLIHGEKFSGVLVSLLFKSIQKETEAGFLAMNQALKSRVEERSRG